jgi:4-diphosphocytidyl-2-C-methyl-D-erythritol kinase
MLQYVQEFAPAKINLALHVLGRRADGYHALDSVVAFASVGDVLDIEIATETSLTVDGPFARNVPVTADNLVLKAHAALAAHVAIPPVAIRLTKNLPVASGIGGGSADAAAALRGIIKLAGVQLDDATVQQIALSLGADVPVCLHGKTCRMQGVGEVITELQHVVAPAILLANPMQACGTADVFRTMGLKPGDDMGSALDEKNTIAWRNDMTAAACKVLPVIDEVLFELGTLQNTRAVRMSGSGATCFALFDDLNTAEKAATELRARRPHWWTASATLT